MTGFGAARVQDQEWSIEVEVRTVNNRHLKLSAKISEPYGALEPDLEHWSVRGAAGSRADHRPGGTAAAGSRITG